VSVLSAALVDLSAGTAAPVPGVPLVALSGTPLFVVLILGGVVALAAGAESLLRGASRLALGLGLKQVTVGVTVVAVATTAPELFVSVLGTLTATTDIGLGAIIGSNIANVGVVIGVAALVRPLSVSDTVRRRHVPVMVLAALLLVAFGFDGRLAVVDGVVLLAVLAGFTVVVVKRAQATRAALAPDALDDEPDPGVREVALVVAGLVGLVVGSRWLVAGGRGLLSAAGFGDLFIGLTVLAFGTSLPELAASLLAAVREEASFSVGNVVGSNIYNVLLVIGVLAVITPIEVSAGVRSFEFPALVVFTLALVVMMRDGRLSRLDGGVLVVGYVLFVWLLFP